MSKNPRRPVELALPVRAACLPQYGSNVKSLASMDLNDAVALRLLITGGLARSLIPRGRRHGDQRQRPAIDPASVDVMGDRREPADIKGMTCHPLDGTA